MRLQIMSDAHMQVDYGSGKDYGRFDFPAAAPNLALLGGMGRICDQELLDFVMHQLKRYERVFYVLGKDEFFGSDFPTTIRNLQDFEKTIVERSKSLNIDGSKVESLGTFHFLHRARIDIGDITILGCTLWRQYSNINGAYREKRADASARWRPIKDFFYEEEEVERNLDLAWLVSELDACANGEAPVSETHHDRQCDTEKLPVIDMELVEDDEDDIYNDIPMSPPLQSSNPPAEQPSDDTRFTNDLDGSTGAINPTLETVPTLNPTSLASQTRQGPARRVLILAAFPPTYHKTSHPKWKPLNLCGDDVETLIKNRQCWALPDGAGNGVSVESPLHGKGAPLAMNHQTLQNSVSDAREKSSGMDIEKTCVHYEAVDPSVDPLRPPGLAAWAFGHSGWSCDVQYDVNEPNLDLKGQSQHKAQESPVQTHNVPCVSCGRVPAFVRMVSNQRGQQWERNRQPYVDIPPSWRAFDEAFVIDV